MSTICANCDYEHEFASVIGETRNVTPRDGSVSLCIRCGEWNIFEDRAAGGLRKPTTRELKQLARDARCVHLRAAWLKTMLSSENNNSKIFSPSAAGTSFFTRRH